ncbi:MAG: capsular biosynthesis protein, partial [Calditrichota bacterium]
MIDIHNHLIPEFDDGPKSFDESLQMLRIAEEQGITDVFATSHFQEIIPHQMEDDYLVKLDELQNRTVAMNLNVNIHSGGELFYHEQLDESIKK